MRPRIITRTVLLLGLVSLLTDVASEMLYPVMPLYLESIGFSVAGIGLLEGAASATAGLSKGYFGQWSDRLGRRLPFVQIGYGISAVAKPLMAVFIAPWWVFLARTAERLGKGIRTGGRDAMLSGAATPATRARVFGFHRAMDTTGAALGPLLALAFLWFFPGQYRWLFIASALPGLLAVVATLLLKEQRVPPQEGGRPGLLEFARYVRAADPAYRRLCWGLISFALINSSDLFLLLMLKQAGLSDTALIGWYVFYNLVYAVLAYPFGGLADRWGPKPVYLGGLLVFAGVYLGLTQAVAWWHFGILFAAYGLYAAATEGVAKAWISKLVPQRDLGTAIGTVSAGESLATLVASTAAGVAWLTFGAEALFIGTAVLSLLVAGYVSRLAG
ncbi:MFS family permease [Lewinella marina]|uniref:MFS transporter n=1 Tax=Neolewinella marina TaxID=438751 RepID=A0A2G0CHJ0_9BACT|nr:MFS transporter [Neolewinella marina]NJB86077.1 MFS family permease [Neolewinella marina]PHK99444.1 MFS transporter [Neolewinella marina]